MPAKGISKKRRDRKSVRSWGRGTQEWERWMMMEKERKGTLRESEERMEPWVWVGG